MDQMFCKLKDLKQHLSSCVFKSCISDHFSYLSIFYILKKTRHEPKLVQINRTHGNSFQAFHNEIKPQFDTLKMNRDLFCDPNKNYQHFEEIILNAKAKHLDHKTVKSKKQKHTLSQWMTNDILNSIKYRDKIFFKSKALSNGTDLHSRLSENLKSYNTILKKLIRQAKIQYYADQFN